MLDTKNGSNSSTTDLLVQMIVRLDALSEKVDQLTGREREPEEDICGIDWVMDYLGKTRPTIYKLTSKGLIPNWHQGRKLYFSKAAIREWLKNGGR